MNKRTHIRSPKGNGMVKSTLEAVARLEIIEERLPVDVAARLARLRVDTGLGLPHCCVLLAVETVGADSVGTFDGGLAQAVRQRGLDVKGVDE